MAKRKAPTYSWLTPTAFHDSLKADTLPAAAAVRKDFVSDIAPVTQAARSFDFIVSTEAVDRDRDTIKASGWKLDGYRKNPVVLWAHDYSQPPVGKCTQIAVDGSQLKARVEFPAKGVHPFADTVCALLEGGFLRGSSVGFKPLEYDVSKERDGGLDFTSQELLEFSIVPIPSNPEALVQARSAGVDLAPVLTWAKGILDSRVDTEVSPATKTVAELIVKEAPEQEAAEVIQFQAMQTLLGQARTLLDQCAGTVTALLADNGGEDQATEEATEDARLSALSAFSQQLEGALYGFMSLVREAQCNNEPQPDAGMILAGTTAATRKAAEGLGPLGEQLTALGNDLSNAHHHVVKAMTGMARMHERHGGVPPQDGEPSLKDLSGAAMAATDACSGYMQKALARCDGLAAGMGVSRAQQDAVTKGADDELELEWPDDDKELHFELDQPAACAKEPDAVFELDPTAAELKATVATVVRSVLTETISQSVAAALNKARGRVD